MTSNPSQFLTSVQPVLETSGPRNCRICKRKDAIPPGDSRSSCERCRDQRRKYRLKRIKERQIAAQKVSTGNVDKSGVEGAQSLSAGSQLAKKGRKTTSQKMGPPPLKKKGKSSKKTLKTEYQTASGLYESLKSLIIAYPMPEFSGHFSIVADPNINHVGRVRAVANYLRYTAGYPMA
ncbi:hypothetical protein AX15_006645 [Amanita polypyramis BW_CC]|nr:hypothetical protein AX15_006645 [Amanita polypyramis BW_CC]